MTRKSNSPAALALLGLAAVIAGCGSGTKQTAARTSPPPAATRAAATPAATATATPTAAATTTKPDTAKRPDSDGNGIPDSITVKGKVGDTLDLLGSGLSDNPNDHTKTDIKVTLKAVRGPFKGYQIPAGRELIGVDLHFADVGELPYENALPSGELTVSGGESGKQTSLIQLGGKNPCPNPSVKLKTGQSKDTCIAFEVPKTGKPQAFQYVSDSGYGDTGLWTLGS
jgi:hypothetical protein